MNCRWFARRVSGNCQLQHRDTSRSAMTSQCIILLWKDFIRSDLKQFFFQLLARQPHHSGWRSNAFWVKQCYAALMLLLQKKTAAELLQRSKSGVTQAILAIVGHQAPTRDTRHPTLHRAAYWHLSTVGRQHPQPSVIVRVIILPRSPRYNNPQDLVYLIFRDFPDCTKKKSNVFICSHQFG